MNTNILYREGLGLEKLTKLTWHFLLRKVTLYEEELDSTNNTC